MSNTTSPCIYPLIDAVRSPFITIGESSCGINCIYPRKFYIFFTDEEEERLRRILLTISLITLSFIPIYFSIIILQRLRSTRSFFSARFTYQCPFFISSGFFLMAFITISPYIFGAASIICDKDEQALIRDSVNNIPCSITAIGMYIGLRLSLFYTCALSISLVLALYWPKLVQQKRWFHLSIWSCIVIGTVPIFQTKSVAGDMYLGFCTTSLTSSQNLLLLDILPLGICTIIFFVCMAMASIKLFRQNKELVRALSVHEDMRSLFHRLLLYNLLQTTALAVVMGNFYYWYVNLNSWKKTAGSIISCAVESTLMNQTSRGDYEVCVMDSSDLPSPPIWTYWFFPFCALVSVFGAMIFQCTVRMQQRSWSTLREAVSSAKSIVVDNSRSMTGRNKVLRLKSLSYTELERAVTNETVSSVSTTVLESLHSKDSIQA